MRDIDQMVYNSSVKPASKLEAICEPLYRYFGITYFWCSKTTGNERFFSIGSDPQMQEFYYIGRQFMHNPFHRNPQFINPGFYFYRHIMDDAFQRTIDKGAEKMHIELIAGISIKKNNSLLRFGYGTDPKKGAAAHALILNGLPLLKKFNTYFLQETRQLRQELENEFSFDLPAAMGVYYQQPPEGFPQALSDSQKLAFLESLGFIDSQALSRLTPRELHCLMQLSSGLTNVQLAKLLGRSPRTVEHYIENIKDKLHCDRKTELLEIAQQLRLAGYFSELSALSPKVKA